MGLDDHFGDDDTTSDFSRGVDAAAIEAQEKEVRDTIQALAPSFQQTPQLTNDNHGVNASLLAQKLQDLLAIVTAPTVLTEEQRVVGMRVLQHFQTQLHALVQKYLDEVREAIIANSPQTIVLGSDEIAVLEQLGIEGNFLTGPDASAK